MEIKRIISSPIGTNSYLLLTKIPALIDAGMNARAVLAAVERFLPLHELAYILLTHYHHDHTGATLEVKSRVGGKVAIHEVDGAFLGNSEVVGSAFFGETVPLIVPDALLKDGDEIDLGNARLVVIHTPGHTPGAICLYEPTEKILFSGDTVFPNGGIGRTDLVGGDAHKLVESVRRLTGLDVRLLAPGHMDMTDDDVKGQIRLSLDFAQSVSR